MAKRRRSPARSNRQALPPGLPENIGTALGKVAARLDHWLAQRSEIARELNDVISRAQGMLGQLSGPDTPWPFGRKGAHRAKVTTPSMVGEAIAATNAAQLRARKAGKRKKFTMSAEARKRISEAQKARWAARKSEGEKRTARGRKAKTATAGAAGGG
jgi:hypothetical protein